MSAFEEFRDLILGEAQRLIGQLTDQDRAVIRESIAETLGEEVVDPTPARELSPKAELARTLFSRFTEILSSFESLESIEKYLRRAPDPSLGVSKAAYLRYHVENYLCELYVLKERLIAYGKLISRRYKSDRRAAEIAAAISNSNDAVERVLHGLTHARGKHVHESRFDDAELSKLAFFDILRVGDESVREIFELIYRDVRSSKRRWIREMNQAIRVLLNAYFERLMPLLCEDGALRLPTNSHPRSLGQVVTSVAAPT